jgi:type VI secretion system protein ImpH
VAGQTWFEAPSLIEKLKAQPETFSYFQALRLLSLAHQSEFDSAVDLMRRGLMVRAGVELGFPSSDLQALEPITAGAADNTEADIADLPGSAGHLYRLTVTFMGLYGSASPLPPFYATEVLDDVLNDENAVRDLLDIISLPSYRNHCEAYFH